MSEKKTTPTNDEVAIIKSVIKIFSDNKVTYERSIELLPEIQRALNHIAMNQIVKN